MDAPALKPNQTLAEIRARLLDPAATTDALRYAVNDLMLHRHDPVAGQLLDDLVAQGDTVHLWLWARACGYLGKAEKLPSLLPLLEHAAHAPPRHRLVTKLSRARMRT